MHWLATFCQPLSMVSTIVSGISHTREPVVEWGLTTLGMAGKAKLLSLEELKAIDDLINRALWVWLVVIALFTIGRWLG